jgi:hypothetical protein
MSDWRSFLGPRVIVGDADIMMTAFNPLYDHQHPRHAPCAVIVIIRTRDLFTIHEKRPDLSFRIATAAKCRMVMSVLANREGLELRAMEREYTAWLDALSYYRDFVTTVFTDSYRMDPRTLPRLEERRKACQEAMESEQFKASLLAFRVIIDKTPGIPTLRRILRQNPDITVFDIAKIVYGDVSGMYVPP